LVGQFFQVHQVSPRLGEGWRCLLLFAWSPVFCGQVFFFFLQKPASLSPVLRPFLDWEIYSLCSAPRCSNGARQFLWIQPSFSWFFSLVRHTWVYRCGTSSLPASPGPSFPPPNFVCERRSCESSPLPTCVSWVSFSASPLVSAAAN